MKKILCALLCLGMLFGCTGDSEPKEKVFLNDDEIDSMFTNPEDYKDKYVTLTGIIFTEPEVDGDVMVLQVFADPENSEQNFIVHCPKLDVKTDDYVKITGYIDGEFEGENVFGGVVTGPVIISEEVEKTDYISAIKPTIQTIDVNQTKTSHDVSFTIQKIEFAEDQTRIYLAIDNQSKYTYTYYSFDTKIVQDSKQYEENDDYNLDDYDIANEILSGVKSEGIITFDKIDSSNDFRIQLSGSSDNYDWDQDNISFEIKI